MKRTSEFMHIELKVPPRILAAFPPLLEAVDYAEQTNGDYWEFAIELETLHSLGLTRNDFRWLVRNGLVEHKREVTLESDDGRAFRPTGDLMFPNGTCFILTHKGVMFSRQSSGNSRTNGSANTNKVDSNARIDVNNTGGKPQSTERHAVESVRPRWDSERRILTLNGTIVKQFKWAAQNQEAVLCAFEEESWPHRVDDPLKPCPEQDSKRRLSDTIKCLNRKQSNPIIHFRGDGTGEGVVWEVALRNGVSGSKHD